MAGAEDEEVGARSSFRKCFSGNWRFRVPRGCRPGLMPASAYLSAWRARGNRNTISLSLSFSLSFFFSLSSFFSFVRETLKALRDVFTCRTNASPVIRRARTKPKERYVNGPRWPTRWRHACNFGQAIDVSAVAAGHSVDTVVFEPFLKDLSVIYWRTRGGKCGFSGIQMNYSDENYY